MYLGPNRGLALLYRETLFTHSLLNTLMTYVAICWCVSGTGADTYHLFSDSNKTSKLLCVIQSRHGLFQSAFLSYKSADKRQNITSRRKFSISKKGYHVRRKKSINLCRWSVLFLYGTGRHDDSEYRTFPKHENPYRIRVDNDLMIQEVKW